MKKVGKPKMGKMKAGTKGVGAPTTYSYGQSDRKDRVNMTPTRAVDK